MKIVKKIKRVIYRIANTILLRRNNVESGNDVLITGFLRIKNTGKSIHIGNNTTIHSGKYDIPIGYTNRTSFWTLEHGKIVIGCNCGISNATLCSARSIILGDHVLLGGGVKIFDTDFHSLDFMKRRAIHSDNDRRSKSVYIDDDVFIGAGAIILKGTHIGKRSIIGAGSVVSGNVPDDEVWAGNPARMVRRLVKNDESTLDNQC